MVVELANSVSEGNEVELDLTNAHLSTLDGVHLRSTLTVGSAAKTVSNICTLRHRSKLGRDADIGLDCKQTEDHRRSRGAAPW